MKSITGKVIGSNIIVVVDGKQYSKRASKEEKAPILEAIEKYNKKNTIKLEKEIIAMMSPITTEKEITDKKQEVVLKAKKQLAKKEVKKEVKKEEETFNTKLAKLAASNASPEEIQKLVNEYKEKVLPTKPVATEGIRRSGER